MSSLLVSLLLALLGVVGSSGTAYADTSLCGGVDYSTCINAKPSYTDHGYGANNGTSNWTMYSGHNCTNYAAYMAIQNGAPATLPFNLGSADAWASNVKANLPKTPVNNTPATGAIAQWNAGHVAYVESVAYNTDGTVSSITVSEDNYPDPVYHPSGWFDWRTITPTGDWPSNFIHFADVTTTTTPTYNLQAPSAITDPATGRNIFYVGADGYMYQWSVIGGAWSNVKLQGSGNPEPVRPGTSPSAVLDSSTGRNVFYVGTDQTIWQWSVQGGAWVNNRLNSSAVLANTSPSAVVDASSGRNIFYVGADQYIYQLSVQNGAWMNIKLTVGGNAIAVAQQSSPSAVVDPTAGREVFYVGADQQIYQWSVQNNAWADIKLTGTGGNTAAASGSSPSAVVDSSTGTNVFYVGADNHIWQWSVQNGAWNDFHVSGTNGDQTVLAGSSPSAVVDPTTGRNVFYVGPDHQMWQWSVQNGAWNNNTLTRPGGAVALHTGTSPSAITDPSSGRNIFYFDGQQMIWQWSVQSGAWVDFKLQ